MKKLKFCALVTLVSVPLLHGAEHPVKKPSSALKPQDLIARALENNLGLEVSRLSAGIGEDSVDGELGKFSPTLGVEIGIDRLYRQQNAADFVSSNISGPYDEDVRYARSSLSGRLPFGSTYELSTGSRRTASTYTRRPTAFYDPEYGTSAQLSLTQPLWRNFGLKVNLAPLNIAKSELAAARLETKSAVETVIARVLLAAYETYFAVENIAVKREAIRLAESLVGDNKKRVELGRMSPINVTQAEARVAEARAELIEAETFYRRRQNQLQELTEGSYRMDAPDYNLSGVAQFLPAVPGAVDPSAYVGAMLVNNPDYLAAMQKVEAEGIRVVYTKNQVNPEINLKLSLGTSGLENDYGQSYQDFENREDLDWGVGLEFNMPLDNRTAKSRYRAAQKRERQVLLEAKQTEIQLMSALDNAIDQLESGLERRELVQETVKLAAEALNAEQRRLENGVTTNYEVLNQQRELSFSQTEALAAEVEVQKAWIQTLLLKGELSRELGIEDNFSEEQSG